MKNLKIDAVMTDNVITAKPAESLCDVISKMARNRVSCVVIAENSTPLGILSEADVIFLLKSGIDQSTPVKEIKISPVEKIGADQSIVDAVIMMEKKALGSVVVLGSKAELKGILTITDIVKKVDDMDFVSRQKVKYSMSKSIILVGEMDSVGDCIMKMGEMNIDNVIVTAQKKGVGIFTRRDAIKAVGNCADFEKGTCGLDTSDHRCTASDPVYKYMTTSLITISPESFIFEACQLMVDNNVRRVIIVNSKGHPNGIISQKELLRRLDSNYSELMSLAVSESENKTNSRDEGELKNLREKAGEAERIKTAFLSSVSHELRTPLTAIIGFGKLIHAKNGLPEDVKKQSGVIVKQGKNLLSMVNKMLGIAGADKEYGETVAQELLVIDILDDAVFTCCEAVKCKNLKVETGIDPALPRTVMVDRESLLLSLEQLVDNAVKFSNEGAKLAVSAKLDGDKILFEVKDFGIGMERGNLESVFENFTQLDDSICREYGGAGLGLPFAKAMVIGMGGTIWGESSLGEGSSFFISIPFYKAG